MFFGIVILKIGINLGIRAIFLILPRTISSSFSSRNLGDRKAEGITYYGVGMAEGTFGCRRLIREVICDFGWRVVE